MPRFSIPIFILLSAFISFGSHAAAGKAVVAVQSVPARPYDQAFIGFAQTLSGFGDDVQRIVLSELPTQDVRSRLSRIKPDLVLSIGLDALTQVADLTNTPVVYVMVLTPPDFLSRRGRATGVRMLVAPEKQIAIVREALPQVRTIGLVYAPQRSEQIVRSLHEAAGHIGISIIAHKINRAEQVPKAVLDMAPKIDLFWMLPDLTVVTPDTVEFLLLFSMESSTPLVTFSEKYAEQGAVLAISSDTRDMGRQAGQMALRILAGADARNLTPEDASKAVVTINLKVARKMGLKLGAQILRTARVLD